MQERWWQGRCRLIAVVVCCSPFILLLIFILFFPLLFFLFLLNLYFRPKLSFHRRQRQRQQKEQNTEGDGVPLILPIVIAEGKLLQKYLEDQLCLVGELGFLFEFEDHKFGSDAGDVVDVGDDIHQYVKVGDCGNDFSCYDDS